jgi:hypothetical protein
VTLSVTDTTGYVASDTLAVDVDNGPPVVDQLEATPAVPLEGTLVTFTGHATDPGADPVTYTWVIDGATYEGDVVLVTFSDDGAFDAELTPTSRSSRSWCRTRIRRSSGSPRPARSRARSPR